MDLEKLLKLLGAIKGVHITSQESSGSTEIVHMIWTILPENTFGKNKRIFYPLVVDRADTYVGKATVIAIYRRLWQLSELPEELLELADE